MELGAFSIAKLLGHWWFFVVLIVGAMTTGAVLLRWKWARVGAGVGVAFAVGILYGFAPASAVARIAIWMLGHKFITMAVLVVSAATGAAAWAVSRRRDWQELETNAARVAAAVAGALHGILVVLLVFVTVAWSARYHHPVGVDTAIPAIKLNVGSYVALGDSYSAGEGLRPYQPGAGDPPGDDCHRSSAAYSQLLSFVTELKQPPAFRACSGLRSGQVFDFPSHGAFGRAVTDGLLTPDTGLVTLTLGGNDLHFSDVLTKCFLKSHCLDARFAPRVAADEVGLPPPAPLHEWAQAALPVLEERLQRVFGLIRQAAPQARIVVLGYPPLLPTGHPPTKFNQCDSVLRKFDRTERAGLRSLEDALNLRVYRAAAMAGAEYVDVSTFFESHEVCGVLGELLNGTKPHGLGPDRGSFHPRREGQRVMARALACYLNEYATPPDPHRVTTEATFGGLNQPPGSAKNPLSCAS